MVTPILPLSDREETQMKQRVHARRSGLLHLVGRMGLLAGLLALPTFTGCGLEGMFIDFIDGDPVVDGLTNAVLDVELPTEVEGIPVLEAYDLQGTLLARTESPKESAFRTYALEIPAASAPGTIRVVASIAGSVYKGFYFLILPENAAEAHTIALSSQTTAASLIVESMGTYRGDARNTPALNAYALASNASDELKVAYDWASSAVAEGAGAGGAFLTLVEEALASGATDPVFVAAASSSVLTGPGFSGDTGDFDEAAASLADQAHAAMRAAGIQNALYDADIRYLQVIFSVSRAGDTENGNCEAYDVCDTQGGKSFDCDPSGTMFMTGAIHADSPIKDPQFENLLGSMTPNQPGWELFDDGTHGDEVAGDLIFTRAFILPETLRVFYKYTWGKPGEKWTGTEEWPGNNRLLEIVDVNGDGYVWRHDKAKDEAYNKDKVNAFQGDSFDGTLTWESDAAFDSGDPNGDGYLEAQENMLATETLDESLYLLQQTGGCYQAFNAWPLPTRLPRATAGHNVLPEASVEE